MNVSGKIDGDKLILTIDIGKGYDCGGRTVQIWQVETAGIDPRFHWFRRC